MSESWSRIKLVHDRQRSFPVEDENLRQQAADELSSDPAIGHEKINVAVFNGVVSLSGHVNSYPTKSRPNALCAG
jgi:osmotically-inducible protein OsmY